MVVGGVRVAKLIVTASYKSRSDQFRHAEKKRNLNGGCFGSIGTMHGVPLNVLGVLLTDRSFDRLLRIGRAHQIAPVLDGIFALEHHNNHGPLRHERDQPAKERLLFMDFVEAFRLLFRKSQHLHAAHTKSGFLDHSKDLARVSGRNCVRLDNCEGLLNRHHCKRFLTVSPISAGEAHTLMPASCMALILSSALPEPPEIIAPACPMRRPGGAVCPAIKPITGFFTFFFTKLAAASSAVPPISPIMTMACVFGSELNILIASTKLVPMMGSPPMPMHVDCPMPSLVNCPTAS